MVAANDSVELNLGPEFEDYKCLNLCELHLILGDQIRLNPKRNEAAQQLLKSFYDYSGRFSKLKYRNAIVDIRTSLEREGVLHEYEMACLVNLLPKSVQEAKSLIPSIARLPERRIVQILDLLESYRIQAS